MYRSAFQQKTDPRPAVIVALCLLQVLFFTAGFAGAQEAYCKIDPSTPVHKTRHLFDITAGFTFPSDIALGAGGQICVLDGVNNRVKVFSHDGEYRFAFGSSGTGHGKFNFPLGLDTDTSGNIYIADSGNHAVQVFDSKGHFLYQFTVQGKSKKPADPCDVAVDEPNKRCYVVDNDNHKVLVYTLDGATLLNEIGSRGEKPKHFNYPFFAAVSSDSTLYVVDVLNTRVQAFNSEGRYLTSLGNWGVDFGQLYRPKGVAVCQSNRVYVSDSYLGVIQLFDNYGTFLCALGDENGGLLRLTTPMGIAIDEHLRLYVVQMTKNKISVYQILE